MLEGKKGVFSCRGEKGQELRKSPGSTSRARVFPWAEKTRKEKQTLPSFKMKGGKKKRRTRRVSLCWKDWEKDQDKPSLSNQHTREKTSFPDSACREKKKKKKGSRKREER